MEAQEIWFGPRRRRGDPGNCPFTQYIRDVACPLDGDFALVEIVFAAIADMSVVSGEPAHYSKELVIAALQRAVARQISEMPFPDKRGAITGAAQQYRQGGKTGRHSHFRRLAVAPAQWLDQPADRRRCARRAV